MCQLSAGRLACYSTRFSHTIAVIIGIMMAMTLALASHAESMKLEVIPLKHRPAESLIDSLKPLLPAEGHITASGNQLIVRSTPHNLTELRRALTALDTPLAQLVISLRRGQNTSVQRQQNQIDGTIRRGNISLSTGKQVKGLETTTSNTRVVIHRGTTSDRQNGVQQVRATEGYPAYIHVGEQVPLVSTHYGNYHGNHSVSKSYKDVVRGFYATPRLVGKNQVVVEIETSNDRKKNGAIETEAFQGVVRGRFGEWIPIASLRQINKSKDKGLNRYNQTSNTQNLDLYLKVERQ